MACLIYQQEGKGLDKCLIKMLLGKATNGIAHVRTHEKLLDAQGKAKSEAIKWKTMGTRKTRETGRNLKVLN